MNSGDACTGLCTRYRHPSYQIISVKSVNPFVIIAHSMTIHAVIAGFIVSKMFDPLIRMHC